MTFLIIAKTPRGSVWTYQEDGIWGCTKYKSREVAQEICARLNGLGLAWSYRVIWRDAA